jgi:hypothetical protein
MVIYYSIPCNEVVSALVEDSSEYVKLDRNLGRVYFITSIHGFRRGIEESIKFSQP